MMNAGGASGVTQVGVISDTHGLMRPQALIALAGVQHIVHAGDIGDPAVLEALRAIAPLTAVRGNNDRGPWAQAVQETELLEIAGHHLYVLHDLSLLDLDPRAAGISAVIAGHSHQPKNDLRDGILYFNPGSAGPRRFKLPIALGRLHLSPGTLRGEIITLEVA
jgi:putative phosphoesterase